VFNIINFIFSFISKVAIGDDLGLIQVYNQSFGLLNSFQAHTNAINRIKQSPFNSNYVATCSHDKTVKIWDISSCWNANWSLIRTYTNHTNVVLGLEWINEDTIASGSTDDTLKIWSIVSGVTLRIINASADVRSLKLLSNGFYLACINIYGINDITIYDINNGSVISTLSGHTKFINDLVQINDDLLASSSADKTVRIWNLTTNSTKFILQGHTERVDGLKFISSDVLASGSNDTTIKLWNITNGKLIRNLTGHTGYIKWSLDKLRDSQALVSGSADKTIKIWYTTTGQCLNSFNTDINIQTLTVLTSIGRTTSINHYFFHFLFLLQRKLFLFIPAACSTTITAASSPNKSSTGTSTMTPLTSTIETSTNNYSSLSQKSKRQNENLIKHFYSF
jgi:WD40 repeat protein